MTADSPSARGPYAAAQALIRVGISVVPILCNGSKRAACTWAPYQQRLATDEELRQWFQREQPYGLATVFGRVSGNLELIDFDDRSATIWPAWVQLVETESPGLFDRLSIVRTPRPGVHVRYRCVELAAGNTKLAQDPGAPEGGRNLIETRGEGGYALAPGCPPACHLSGKTYERMGGTSLLELQPISADERALLWRCARSFNVEAAAPKVDPGWVDNGWRVFPGDDFCARGPDWGDILSGWTCVRDGGDTRYWRRPGKDGPGWSATTGHCTNAAGWEVLCVFTTSTSFPGPHDGKSCSVHSKFQAYATLNHSVNGQVNFRAAARALAEIGYGQRANPKPAQAQAPPHANGSVNGTAKAAPETKVPAQAKEKPARKRRLPDTYVPFPLATLPEPVREYVTQAAISIGCDPAYIALPALAVCASAIGNTRSIRLKRGWEEPAVLWTAVIGDSGTLKTPAFKAAVAPLFAEQKKMRDEFRSAMKLHRIMCKNNPDTSDDKAAPVQRRVVVSDTTIERLAVILQENERGVLLARDELAGWLASFSRYKSSGAGSDLPQWLEAYQAGAWIIDRKTGDRPVTYVEAASVSIAGSIQPGVLRRAMTGEYLDAGLGARLLMASPPRRAKRWTEDEVLPDVRDRYYAVVRALLALPPGRNNEGETRPHSLILADDAKAIWRAHYDEWAQEQAAVEGDLAAAFSKLEGAAARLALVHHVVLCLGLEVDDRRAIGRVSIDAGIALARWFAAEVRRIYGTFSETSEDRSARSLLEWIIGRGGEVTVRDLYRSSRRYTHAEDAQAALDALVSAEMGVWIEAPMGLSGGRPSRTFKIFGRTDKTAAKTPLNDEIDDFGSADTES